MALTATLSELYGAFRRRAGRAAQGMGIADTRFNTTDEKLDALNPTMEQRLNGLSQPFDGLKRELDQRSDALICGGPSASYLPLCLDSARKQSLIGRRP